MSEVIVQRTLMTISPSELLELHSRRRPPAIMSRQENRQFLRESGVLYGFGRYLQYRTGRMGWGDPLSGAIHVGSDGLALSTLDWLHTPGSKSAKDKTGLWLKDLPSDFWSSVESEIGNVAREPQSTAEAAEAEIQDYPAFVALCRSLGGHAIEEGRSAQETSAERAGAALVALAIKRQLD